MAYHITGLVSAAIFLLTLSGLWAQLRFVWQRRADFCSGVSPDQPTAILSVNQFVSSFLAFASFFLYGACLKPTNHYLVWPRLMASLLTLAVLGEIVRDRRTRPVMIAFAMCLLLIIGGPLALLIPGATVWGRAISQALIVVATVVLAQGYLHQVFIIRRTGRTGGVSARMHWFFLWKDLSSIAFAVTMGTATGWPITLLSTVSAITKVITLWHFRWVRLSPLAQSRREAAE